RNHSRCRVARPQSVEEVAALFAEVRAAGGTIGLRGAGCSYGDAALNSGAVVLDCTALNRVLAWDPTTGIVTVEPGVTIAQLWRHILPDGWWPTVVPGTSAVTIGGAAAANVHGKNNWHAGCFGDYVLAFDLLLPDGRIVTCSRDEHADLFFAAIGGSGLLGCFTQLTLQARRVYSGYVSEVQTAHTSLDALLDALDAATGSATDLVAWTDTGASGKYLGRGLLKAGRDLAPGEDLHPARSLTVAAQEHRGLLMRSVPTAWVPRLARPLTTPLGVWAANRGQWLRGQAPGSRKPHLETYAAANFLLDAIPNWRETYLPGGLIQHQSFIPREAAAGAFREILRRSQAAGIVPSLSVLKKHRGADPPSRSEEDGGVDPPSRSERDRPAEFTLTYLLDGYSLALDYPIHRGTEARTLALLRELNDVVADHGGRCYFAKDSTVTAEQARRMFPAERLARFAALKRQYDPQGLLTNDLYRRVLAPNLA
ncbi:MAG TPA: FAD-binding oxidoreductase, partial [Ktedonobacterales bacterium]|nr:FAD-binding oxidoreductase [Ktedonobacterales bacterium]